MVSKSEQGAEIQVENKYMTLNAGPVDVNTGGSRKAYVHSVDLYRYIHAN